METRTFGGKEGGKEAGRERGREGWMERGERERGREGRKEEMCHNGDDR